MSGEVPAGPQGAARSPPAAHASKFGEDSVPGPKPAATASRRRRHRPGPGPGPGPECSPPPNAVSRGPEEPGPHRPQAQRGEPRRPRPLASRDAGDGRPQHAAVTPARPPNPHPGASPHRRAARGRPGAAGLRQRPPPYFERSAIFTPSPPPPTARPRRTCPRRAARAPRPASPPRAGRPSPPPPPPRCPAAKPQLLPDRQGSGRRRRVPHRSPAREGSLAAGPPPLPGADLTPPLRGSFGCNRSQRAAGTRPAEQASPAAEGRPGRLSPPARRGRRGRPGARPAAGSAPGGGRACAFPAGGGCQRSATPSPPAGPCPQPLFRPPAAAAAAFPPLALTGRAGALPPPPPPPPPLPMPLAAVAARPPRLAPPPARPLPSATAPAGSGGGSARDEAAVFVQNHAPRAIPPPHPIILRRAALATAGAAPRARARRAAPPHASGPAPPVPARPLPGPRTPLEERRSLAPRRRPSTRARTDARLYTCISPYVPPCGPGRRRGVCGPPRLYPRGRALPARTLPAT